MRPHHTLLLSIWRIHTLTDPETLPLGNLQILVLTFLLEVDGIQGTGHTKQHLHEFLPPFKVGGEDVRALSFLLPSWLYW